MKKSDRSPIDKDVQTDVNKALSRASRSLDGSSIVKRMTYTTTLTSNASGQFGLLLTSNQVKTNPATEWSSFATRYNDFRVLKLKVSFTPYRLVNTQNAGTALFSSGAGYIARDPSGSAAGGSRAAVLALEGSKSITLLRPWKMMILASQREHLVFSATSVGIAAASLFQLVAFADGLDNSTLYGEIHYEWIVELRGAQ